MKFVLPALVDRRWRIHTASLRLLVAAMACCGAAMSSGQHAGGHAHGPSGIGRPGTEKEVNRTVEVEMTDAMRFAPAEIAVRKGETIRFIVRNSGQLRHEFVLGTGKALKEHADLMKKFPLMVHEEGNMVSLLPGQTGNVIWQFTRSGKVPFACLQPGHFDAGMKGLVSVDSAKKK